MAFNQYGDIKERVRDYLDGRTDIDSKILQWVNDTRRAIAIANPNGFSYLYTESPISTVPATARYALPSDYLGHLNMFIGTKKLIHVRANEFDSVHGASSDITNADTIVTPLYTRDSTEQGEPDYYIDRGMEFDLWPVPDMVYTITIKYYAQPTAWTIDADYDFISTFHTDAVIFGATLRGAIYLEDKDKKAEFEPLYKAEVGNMIRMEKDKKFTDMAVRMKTYKDFTPSQFRRVVKIS